MSNQNREIQGMNVSDKTDQILSQDACDIFISYKSSFSFKDAEVLQRQLSERQYRVFRDKGRQNEGQMIGLNNGELWIQGLYRRLKEARIIIILIQEGSLNGFDNENWENGHVFTEKGCDGKEYKCCFDKNEAGDIFCQEIDYALKNAEINKKIIIPIFEKGFSNECGRENVNHVLNRINNFHHSICYSKIEENEKNLIFSDGIINQLCKEFNFYGIFPFGKKAEEINVEDFFYDVKRASPAQGYLNDCYVEREIDEKIRDFVDNDKRNKYFFIVTGKPGSGKTRAIFEWVHSENIKGCNIVPVNKINVKYIIDRIANLSQSNSTNRVFFVCDQVNEIFSNYNDDFFSKIRELGYSFLGSDTEDEYNKLKEKSAEIKNFSVQGVITPLSDVERERFRAKYPLAPFTGKEELAADFIPILKEHKKNIINKILDKSRKLPAMSSLLKAIQITKYILEEDKIGTVHKIALQVRCQDSDIIACLNYLISNDIHLLSIKYIKYITTSTVEKNTIESLMSDDIPIIDDFYFSIEEDMVWELLQNSQTGLLYNMSSVRDVMRICGVICETFSTPNVLYRLLYNINSLKDRIPITSIEAVRNFAIEKIGKNELKEWACCGLKEKQKAISALIELSNNSKQISEILDLIQTTNARIIGSLFRIAKEHQLKENNDDNFPGFSILLNQEYKKYTEICKEQSQEDIIRIFCELESGYKKYNFADAIRLCENIKIQFRDSDVINDLGHLMSELARLCTDSNNLDKLWEFHERAKIPLSINTAMIATKVVSKIHENQWYSYAHKRDIVKLISRINKGVELERGALITHFAIIIQQQYSFTVSRGIYEYMRHKLQMHKDNSHEPKLITLCLENCEESEFQEAVAYVRELKIDNKQIAYNNLIRKAPTLADAYYVLGLMPDNSADEFTLSNCLNILRIKKRYNFINVYELLCHPQFRRALRNIKNNHCVSVLYGLAQDQYQEYYIHRLFNKDSKNFNDLPPNALNNYIIPTLINKSYRTINDAYAIYDDFIGEGRKGLTCPNIYNAMCLKIIKSDDVDKKLLNKLLCDISEGLKIGLNIDIYLYCNYYFLKRKEGGGGDADEFVFKDNSLEFSEGFLDVIKKEQLELKTQKDITKKLAFLIRCIKNVYFQDAWERGVKIYDYFKDKYNVTWNKNIRDAFKHLSSIPMTKEQCLFISKEKKNSTQSSLSNTHAAAIEDMQKAKDANTVLCILSKYCNEHINSHVSPAIVNTAIESVLSLSKKEMCQDIYNNIVEILNKDDSLDKLSSYGYALLVSLAPNDKDVNKWIECFDERNHYYYGDIGEENGIIGDFSERAFGRLAVNSSICIETARKYYKRWLQTFKDIYLTHDVIASMLSDDEIETLGRFLQRELSKKVTMSLEIVEEILSIYSYSRKSFKYDYLNNYSVKELMSYCYKKASKGNMEENQIEWEKTLERLEKLEKRNTILKSLTQLRKLLKKRIKCTDDILNSESNGYQDTGIANEYINLHDDLNNIDSQIIDILSEDCVKLISELTCLEIEVNNFRNRTNGFKVQIRQHNISEDIIKRLDKLIEKINIVLKINNSISCL